jgi:hypothetical protein
MPRVHTVNKARASKRTRTCRTCGHEIKPGESYRYFEPRYGPPVMYCHEHYPRRSHMTTSKLGSLYDAQDDFDASAIDSIDDLQGALQTIADTAREVASEYEDSISNMPEGLQEGPTAEDMREKIDALEAYADELEQFEPDVETFDEDQAREEAREEVAIEMISEMEDNNEMDAARERAKENLDTTTQEDDDEEDEDPFEDLTQEEIVEQYGDEAQYASRVDDRIEQLREAFTEEHGDALDAARDEATELVSGFDY